ncbi:MAG: VOC family protein [Alphaproteobacteria bacterium]
MNLDHVNIRVPDQDAVKDFLVGVLNLRVGRRPDFGFPGYWLYLGEQAVIHMQASAGDQSSGWVDHLAFGPFDLASKSAELQERGVAFSVAEVPGADLKQIFVEGPCGVRLELQCPMRKRNDQ